jgi:hypothetical protein
MTKLTLQPQHRSFIQTLITMRMVIARPLTDQGMNRTAAINKAATDITKPRIA